MGIPRQPSGRRSDPSRMHDDDLDRPTCRATIRDGTVTLNPWRLGMGPRGPLKAGYAHVTAVLADLHHHDDELIVVPVRGTPWAPDAPDALLTWAARAGYRRVWLPDRVVDLDALAESGWASVACPCCGARWEDGGPRFWETVRHDGWFPAICLACGGSLPEWDVEATAPAMPHPAAILASEQ